MMCERHYNQYIRTRSKRAKQEEFARAVADEEREKIINLLKRSGHDKAAQLVSSSFRKSAMPISKSY
jgi:hypothetical protein